MRSVRIEAGGGAYEALIGAGALSRLASVAAPWTRGGRLNVVSDETIWEAQGAALLAAASAGELVVRPWLVPAGESAKSWAVLEGLCNRLLGAGFERGEALVAFGGGVVGDLAGFAAAIVKRGTPWIGVPTSLVAMVDSSIGGKTGINASGGKNQIGAFHAPVAVLVDPALLATLPPAELRAGYAEIVKYGLIGDANFFAWCEREGAALVGGSEEARLHAIAACIEAKAAIVGGDERDLGGGRALLNLGHSFGHAIETVSAGGVWHGEAVAIGLRLAFDLSAELGLCPSEDARRVAGHLRAVGLPTSTPLAPEALIAVMAHDKKVEHGRLRLILARGIGRAFVGDGIEPAALLDFLQRAG